MLNERRAATEKTRPDARLVSLSADGPEACSRAIAAGDWVPQASVAELEAWLAQGPLLD